MIKYIQLIADEDIRSLYEFRCHALGTRSGDIGIYLFQGQSTNGNRNDTNETYAYVNPAVPYQRGRGHNRCHNRDLDGRLDQTNEGDPLVF